MVTCGVRPPDRNGGSEKAGKGEASGAEMRSSLREIARESV